MPSASRRHFAYFCCRTKVWLRAGRIWSPPSLQGLCFKWQGQDCCRISGLFIEDFTLTSLNDFRAYRPYRDHGLYGPSSRLGFQYAGLTCCAITVDKAFAIRGGTPPRLQSLLTNVPIISLPVDRLSDVSRRPNRCAPSCSPMRQQPCSSRVPFEYD